MAAGASLVTVTGQTLMDAFPDWRRGGWLVLIAASV